MVKLKIQLDGAKSKKKKVDADTENLNGNSKGSGKPINLGFHMIKQTKAMREELIKIYVLQQLKKHNCCYCFKLNLGLSLICCYVLLRGFLLLMLSFIPPLIHQEQEPSPRYPNGHQYWNLYFENSNLIIIYTLNVIACFFMLCYSISLYYSWILVINQSKKINKSMGVVIDKLPRSHMVFTSFIVVQTAL